MKTNFFFGFLILFLLGCSITSSPTQTDEAKILEEAERRAVTRLEEKAACMELGQCLQAGHVDFAVYKDEGTSGPTFVCTLFIDRSDQAFVSEGDGIRSMLTVCKLKAGVK